MCIITLHLWGCAACLPDVLGLGRALFANQLVRQRLQRPVYSNCIASYSKTDR